jgi:hypothetical protein
MKLFQFPRTSDDLFRRFGTYGFSRGTNLRAPPTMKNYTFGPEISVNSFRVDGKRIDLARPSANFLDQTASSEVGSCPYLLSWDAIERDWIEHGKILHQAPSKADEYSEVRVFPGFRARFRIEEREPETAFIGHGKLDVTLKDGTTFTLKPHNNKLDATTSHREIYWGESIELRFSLPKDTSENDVLESRLSVTGYYERYVNHMAQSNALASPRLLNGLLQGPSSRTEQGSVCRASISRAADLTRTLLDTELK